MSTNDEVDTMEPGRGKRRIWSAEERRRIVTEALAPNASVAATARQHGVNANLVFKWIRHARGEWRDGRSAAPAVDANIAAADTTMTFIPVEVVASSLPAPSLSSRTEDAGQPSRPRASVRRPARQNSGMEIALPNGARIPVGSVVDPEALRCVLAALVDLRC